MNAEVNLKSETLEETVGQTIVNERMNLDEGS